MKICITSQSDNLESQVDSRFGRCPFFIFIDTDSEEIEALENPNKEGAGGAGIRSGQLMGEKQVKAVLTGNVGPNAFQTLQAGNIEVITGVSGKVKEAIEKYKRGELKATQGPSVDSHFGTS